MKLNKCDKMIDGYDKKERFKNCDSLSDIMMCDKEREYIEDLKEKRNSVRLEILKKMEEYITILNDEDITKIWRVYVYPEKNYEGELEVIANNSTIWKETVEVFSSII
jgi:hypothetical protein